MLRGCRHEPRMNLIACHDSMAIWFNGIGNSCEILGIQPFVRRLSFHTACTGSAAFIKEPSGLRVAPPVVNLAATRRLVKPLRPPVPSSQKGLLKRGGVAWPAILSAVLNPSWKLLDTGIYSSDGVISCRLLFRNRWPCQHINNNEALSKHPGPLDVRIPN